MKEGENEDWINTVGVYKGENEGVLYEVMNVKIFA